MTTSNTFTTEVPRLDHRLGGFEPGDPRARLTGRLLGEATSRRDSHNHDGPAAPEGQRCSACRWFEVRVFRTSDEPLEYTVWSAGFSTRPGEVTLPKVQRTTSAFDVLELLTVRNSREGTFIPKPNARVLAQAAGHDRRIQDAYLNRVMA